MDVVGILARNTVVDIVKGGGTCRIDGLLGAGGQGEVYRATWDKQAVAVKWYYPDRGSAMQRGVLERLIASGPPNDRFLWPIALVTQSKGPGFGYVMPLREDRFGNITDLLARRITPTFRALTAAGMHLADAFFQLHGMGLCYRDISHNNVFLDPRSGDILVCDNDNAGPVDRPSDIGGTMRYMAPEVVMGGVPSVDTDRYSLAVLLFTMLMNHHPLEGAVEAKIRCMDNSAMRYLYGESPVFIWDPHNTVNRPTADYQINAQIFWQIYPDFLKETFVQAFTLGMREPSRRVTEGTWRKVLSRLHASIVHCPLCRRQNFFRPFVENGVTFAGMCWGCRRRMSAPPRMRLGGAVVVLEPGSELYPHHLDPTVGHGFDRAEARVTKNPNDPSRLGLTNLGSEPWTVIPTDNVLRQVDPQRTIELSNGMKIKFGKVDAEVKL